MNEEEGRPTMTTKSSEEKREETEKRNREGKKWDIQRKRIEHMLTHFLF
jgi:hypothetical protein